MTPREGLPFVKFMMLLSSMAPLFILTAIRGIDILIPYRELWIVVAALVIFPYVVVRLRIRAATRNSDTFMLDVSTSKNNKEYLFTYLFTVLLPLYSLTITNTREFAAMMFAIVFVIFVLWNLNLHVTNILFALQGYKVFTMEDTGAIVLTTRHQMPKNSIAAHRLSNSVFIELKGFNYGNG